MKLDEPKKLDKHFLFFWIIEVWCEAQIYVIFQVIEFVQFKEQLQRSNQYLVARVETSILRLKQNSDNIEEEEVMNAFQLWLLVTTCRKHMTID